MLLCTCLINLPLRLCVPAVMMFNVFCYCTYSNSLNLKLMRLSRRRRLRKRDAEVQIGDFTYGSGRYWEKWSISANIMVHYILLISHAKERYMILQLLRSLFTLVNNISARLNHLHYSTCVQFILLQGTDAAPAALRTSEVFRWNGKHGREGGSFDKTGGSRREHKARWLWRRGDRDEKTRLPQVCTNTETFQV